MRMLLQFALPSLVPEDSPLKFSVHMHNPMTMTSNVIILGKMMWVQYISFPHHIILISCIISLSMPTQWKKISHSLILPRARYTYRYLSQNFLTHMATWTQNVKPEKLAVHKSKPMAVAAPGPNGKANGKFLKDGHWKEVFIPMLTHALYISWEPFLDWTSESLTVLANVQEVFNLTFTNVDICLSSKDSVITMTTVCQIYVPIPFPDCLIISNLARPTVT